MTFLEKIRQNALNDPDRIVYRLESKSEQKGRTELTWGELESLSDNLSGWLKDNLKTDLPVVVYGHKTPWMLVCFIACAKAKRAYCPVDLSVPRERVLGILDSLKPEMILAPEEDCELFDGAKCLDINAIKEYAAIKSEPADLSTLTDTEDLVYLIYTSGSTGTPKGVQITRGCLDNFIKWGMTLGSGIRESEHPVFMNQAPFSFDLSVMDLYLCLYSGGTLIAIAKDLQGDMKLLFEAFNRSGINVWVSTPSFANICLSDPKFDDELMPGVQKFLFCGETLPNHTVSKLHAAFKNAEVVNTYGPTESTVAVTGITVTKEVNEKYEPLPVGAPKEGTKIRICSEDGSVLGDGEYGEIIIVGDTVSPGYRNNEEQTKKAFFMTTENGKTVRAYRTGDKGCMRDGQLFYAGRIDLQIKLHGFRIELEDIENNLMKLDGVERAAVIPNYRDGEVRNITAYIMPAVMPEDSFKAGVKLREEAKKYLPEYMIPKKIIFKETLPVTNNGKTDRKALAAMLDRH